MTESSDTSDRPAKPHDYLGIRAELAMLVNDFTLVRNELWHRLEDHKYRWELHSYGLPEGYDRLDVIDIIGSLETSDRQRRIAGYEAGVPLFHTAG